jgi:glycosyltransferase involved in cell wall biosynthesis
MNNPQVSIGMPVYNGEPFLLETLEAILAQTYQDFELIICDNASTDNTEKICRQYAAQDKRISYYRHPQNIGAAGNFNQVFQLSSGKYFKWAAHDDLYAADYLAQCVEVLDQDLSVVLCHSQVQIIDSQGNLLSDYNISLNTDSHNPVTRFHALLTPHLCYPIFGLIRASTLRKTALMGNYGHTDGVLLASIALQGKFHEISQPLFFSRNHPRQSMNIFFPEYLLLAAGEPITSAHQIPDYYGYAVWFDPALRGQIIFPHWRIFWEYCSCIWQSPLSIRAKISCHFSIFKQLQGMKFLLIRDFVISARQSFDLFASNLQETSVVNANSK